MNALRYFLGRGSAIPYIKNASSAFDEGPTLERIIPNIAVPGKYDPATICDVSYPFGVGSFRFGIGFRKMVCVNLND
jgi:hypothetical protein